MRGLFFMTEEQSFTKSGETHAASSTTTSTIPSSFLHSTAHTKALFKVTVPAASVEMQYENKGEKKQDISGPPLTTKNLETVITPNFDHNQSELPCNELKLTNTYSNIQEKMKIVELGTGIVNNSSSIINNTISARANMALGNYYVAQNVEVKHEGYRKDKTFAAKYSEENYKNAIARIIILHGKKDETIHDIRDRLNGEKPGKFEEILELEIQKIEGKIKEITKENNSQFQESSQSQGFCLMM